MSEGWAIALLSGALLVMTSVLTWVAAELRLLHKSLRGFVEKSDCREDVLLRRPTAGRTWESTAPAWMSWRKKWRKTAGLSPQ